MRVVIQRVGQAKVTVDGNTVGKVGRGLLLLLGITHTDGENEARYMAQKVANLRLFEDDNGKMNVGLLDIQSEEGGAVLVVSQFTLYGDVRKGRRPSFVNAARPEVAKPLYEYFCQQLENEGVRVATGQFQATMEVSLVNDGPVTLFLDSDELMPKSV